MNTEHLNLIIFSLFLKAIMKMKSSTARVKKNPKKNAINKTIHPILEYMDSFYRTENQYPYLQI